MRIRPGGHASQLVLPEPELDLPMGHVVQLVFVLLVVSSLATDVYVPVGQDSQAVVWVKGFTFGCAMNVPGEQHPKRPVVFR
jgi:hypothetical protein